MDRLSLVNAQGQNYKDFLLNFNGTPIKEVLGEEGTTSAKHEKRLTSQTFGVRETPSPQRQEFDPRSFAEQTHSKQVSKYR